MKKTLLLAFTLLTLGAYAQQDAQYSQYMFNGLALNPAYAGNKKVLNATALVRTQWTGIKGAPNTQTISLDGSAFRDKVGLGLHIINDQLGAQGQLSVYTSYAYKLRLSQEGTLSFGLAAGLSQYSIDGNKVNFGDSQADGAFPTGTGQAKVIKPDAKFGLYYSTDNKYLGFSISDILGLKINYNLTSNVIVQQQARHYFLTGGYVFNIADNWKLYPSFLVKEDLRAPTNIDLNAFVLFNEKIWLGVSYRTSTGILKKTALVDGLRASDVVAFIAECYVTDRVRIGYAYDYTTSALGGYSNGSHELSLGYYFLKQNNVRRMLTPRYF